MSGIYKMKHLLYTTVAAVLVLAGCKKIDEGYLSDGIYYSDSPILVERGIAFQKTSALSMDGTTVPITVKLLDIRKVGSGKRAEEFFKEYPVYVYKEAVDPDVDTTIEQVNAKRELKNMPPFQFLSSGQFVFNGATDSLPVDTDYEFDIEVSNVAGVRTYKNVGIIHTMDGERYTINAQANNAFQDFTGTVVPIGNPKITITAVSDTGHHAILKIVDEDGKPFNPKSGEIIKRGDRPTFENYARFHPIINTDTSMICNFEITPFPIKKIPTYNFLMYYRIPSQFITLSPSIPGLDPKTGYSANPLFEFHIKKAGTYVIEIRLLKVKKKS